MSKPFAIKVTSNVKGGVSAELSSKTLIVGRNTAGKSAVLNALELALSGTVSDVAGRTTLSKESDLFDMLAPPGAEKLEAVVHFDDKDIARFELVGGHRAMKSGPQVSFPLREVREAVLGSPETARKWILSHVDGPRWVEIRARMPAVLVPLLDRLVLPKDQHKAGELLPTAIDDAKHNAREAASSVKALRETAKRNAQGLGPPPSDEQLEASKKRGFAAELTAAAERRKEAQLALVAADEVLDAAEAALAATPTAEVSPLVASMATILKAHIEQHAGRCYVCGGEAPDFAARLAQLQAKIDAAEVAQKEHSETAALAQRAAAEVDKAGSNLRLADSQAVALEKMIEQAGPDPKLVALRSQWAAIRQIESDAVQAEREAREWKQLADALGNILLDTVESARLAFESRVQKYLPERFAFGLDLRDNVCRFGLRSDGKLRAALSGAEWATVTAALAMACAPDDRPVIVAPEERAFDPETLTEVLTAFSSSSAQVIVTSPVAPSSIPAGWAIVFVGDQPAEQPKRKRGRPRKSTAAAPPAAPPAAPGEPAEPAQPSLIVIGTCPHDRGPGESCEECAHIKEKPPAVDSAPAQAFDDIFR